MTEPRRTYTASQLLPSGHVLSREPAGLEHLSDKCPMCQLEAHRRVLEKLKAQARFECPECGSNIDATLIDTLMAEEGLA